ncbi:MAG: hypothetical protein WB586_02675 [Chthoniobacterales bacterium]
MSNPYEGDSLTTTPAGLTGRNTASSGNGIGVLGTSTNGEGVHGETNSTQFAAVAAIELNPSSNIAAVYGEQRGNGPGVYGIAKGRGGGVFGGSANGEGVHGETNSTQFAAVAGIELNPSSNIAAVYGEQRGNGPGLFGIAKGNGAGVFGTSANGEGVHGETNSTTFAAVSGIELNPSSNIAAVYGEQRGNGPGLFGIAKGNGVGVWGTSANGEGVHGETNSTQFAAVSGIELNPSSNIAAVYGEQRGNGPGLFGIAKGNGAGVFGTSAGGLAGQFQGDVLVTGTLRAQVDVVLTGGDCAEDFDVAGSARIEPGSVMVIDEEGRLMESGKAYDNRVAGVISGAGDYKPGIVLDKKQASAGRLPVALVGKVYCKVDAGRAPVAVGDLLTTSATPGHAMKAEDPVRAFGSVIGKALRPLKAGRGLIPILVALQ